MDWAGDKHEWKSQGGCIFKIAGATISWTSKKQTVVARSTTEAEYLACSEATREAQGLIYLHRDVTGETIVPIFHCDSNGALSTICSTITSDKAKHIDVYCAHSIGLHLRYSRAHGMGLRSHAHGIDLCSRSHGISLRSHVHGIGSSRSCLDKRFLHLRGSDIHAKTKSLSFFIGFIGSLPLSFIRCTALFFLLRVSPPGFTAEVLMRPLGLYVFHFSSFMAFLYVGLACMLAATERNKRGSVAISHSFCFVTCRITSYTCIQTFHFSCLSL